MGYKAEILADSVTTLGERLTTWELSYPKFVHNELMTHRVFSRNTSSSRAVPVEKVIEQVQVDPVLPVEWGRTQKGMVAGQPLGETEAREAECAWLQARDAAVEHARALLGMKVHKQIANRVLEPWVWVTAIVSATEWENWFALRTAPDAQPEIRHLALLMEPTYRGHAAEERTPGEWHLPLVTDRERSEDGPRAVLMSVARCARVSYVRQHVKTSVDEDVALHDRLAASGHWSPFEHPAMAAPGIWSGNFRGWNQYRKQFRHEGRADLLRQEVARGGV